MNIFTPKKNISTVISENDKMYGGVNPMKHYMYVSASAMDCIIYALNMAGKTNAGKILDLPCGHGRVLRSLVSYFPDSVITACDLERDAVDFCVDNFGVEGVYSKDDLSKVAFGKKYDLIWCGSLLTHLDEHISRKFFNDMIDLLEDDGVLVVTFMGRYSIKYYENDESRKDVLQWYKTGDYGYIPAVYIIDGKDEIQNYGDAYTKMSWVSSLIQNNEDLTTIYYSETRFDRNHDVLAVQKRSVKNRPEFTLYNDDLPAFIKSIGISGDDINRGKNTDILQNDSYIEILNENRMLQSELTSLMNNSEIQKKEIESLRNSTSWRITEPLRRFKKIISK